MHRTDYLIIAAVVAIILIALYIRETSSTQLVMKLAMNATAGSMYPYQTVQIPILVSNNGSNMASNVSLEITINGNFSRYYDIGLAPGKETYVIYNFTPQVSGTYEIGAVLDPGHVQDISNRNDTQSAKTEFVLRPSAANPFSMLVPNAHAVSYFYGSPYAFSVLNYLKNYYGINISGLENATGADALIIPVLNATSSIIGTEAVGYAGYNGSYGYSIWLNGETTPEMLKEGIAYYDRSISFSNATSNGTNMYFARLSNSTTLCDFYSGGWTKLLVFTGNDACNKEISSANSNSLSIHPLFIGISNYSAFYNTTNIGNLYSKLSNKTVIGFVNEGNSMLDIFEMTKPGNLGGICYGLISNYSGSQYCSEYEQAPSQSKQSVSGISMIRTYRNLNASEVSAFTFVNTSMLLSSVPRIIDMIGSLNLTGKGMKFVSGFNSSCSFGSGFRCSGISFSNSTITFNLTNLNNSSISAGSASCYQGISGQSERLNFTLEANQTKTLSLICYNGAEKVSGIPLGLILNMKLNYSIGGRAYTAYGNAYITELAH